METGIWAAEQRIQNATLMLYHKIKNSDEEWKIKKMIAEQVKKNYKTNFYKKSTADSRNLGYWNRESNRQEKINMKKRSKWESNITGKKENEWRDGSQKKMSNNRKWQVRKKGIHKKKTIVEQFKI